MVQDISRHSAKDLKYEEFVESYMKPGLPVIIQGLTKGWEATKQLVSDGETEIDWQSLLDSYGTRTVPVTRENGDCEEMTLQEFKQRARKERLYLKDWHFAQQMALTERIYTTPVYFADDWLNEYTDATGVQDYRFVYLGVEGTQTPLHHDVLLSYSWSVNIAGQKQWILIPPHQAKHVEKNRHELYRTVDEIPVEIYETLDVFHVTQGVDEAIFVPSGWIHQVTNLKDTLSINHNWFNAYNLKDVHSFIITELDSVIAEIDHCRDTFEPGEFDRHCQVLLRANVGMSVDDFNALVSQKRKKLQESEPPNDFALQQIDEIVGKI